MQYNSLNNNSKEDPLDILSDQLCKKVSENVKSPTSTSTKICIRTKSDSAYSSFVSQKTFVNMNSNSSLIKDNHSFESPGTSFSSRNSALVNDEEMEEYFNSIENEAEKLIMNPSSITESFFRRAVFNSPWTSRPESAPLNEEEEDSEKEASNYCCNSTVIYSNVSKFPEINHCHNSVRSASFSEDNRNDIIAFKLQQIAEKLPRVSSRKANQKTGASGRRYSYSSFTDMMPNSMGSVLDLIISLYDIYKHHSKCTQNCLGNSRSIQNKFNLHKRVNSRNRSYTE